MKFSGLCSFDSIANFIELKYGKITKNRFLFFSQKKFFSK